MQEIIEKMKSLMFSNLVLSSPVLSGNMKESIKQDGEQIIIEAPFYDMKRWQKDGVIVHTGKVINGFTDYAYIVNQFGAFGKHNKSEGWVNRAILDVVNTVANEIGAEVINELGL